MPNAKWIDITLIRLELWGLLQSDFAAITSRPCRPGRMCNCDRVACAMRADRADAR